MIAWLWLLCAANLIGGGWLALVAYHAQTWSPRLSRVCAAFMVLELAVALALMAWAIDASIPRFGAP